MNGHWFLTFRAWDHMESMSYSGHTERIPLEATTEAAALAEGRERWEVERKRWTPERGVLGEEFPGTPRVVYQVDL